MSPPGGGDDEVELRTVRPGRTHPGMALGGDPVRPEGGAVGCRPARHVRVVPLGADHVAVRQAGREREIAGERAAEAGHVRAGDGVSVRSAGLPYVPPQLQRLDHGPLGVGDLHAERAGPRRTSRRLSPVQHVTHQLRPLRIDLEHQPVGQLQPAPRHRPAAVAPDRRRAVVGAVERQAPVPGEVAGMAVTGRREGADGQALHGAQRQRTGVLVTLHGTPCCRPRSPPDNGISAVRRARIRALRHPVRSL